MSFIYHINDYCTRLFHLSYEALQNIVFVSNEYDNKFNFSLKLFRKIIKNTSILIKQYIEKIVSYINKYFIYIHNDIINSEINNLKNNFKYYNEFINFTINHDIEEINVINYDTLLSIIFVEQHYNNKILNVSNIIKYLIQSQKKTTIYREEIFRIY